MAFGRQTSGGNITVPVELDMDDVRVPLTKERALGLQAEMFKRFSSLKFQNELREMRRQHLGEGGDGHRDEFRKKRMELVLRAQADVLPKYGFQATLQGQADMRNAVRALESDAEIKSNTEVIDHLLGDGDAEWMVLHGPEVSHLEDLSHTLAPDDSETALAVASQAVVPQATAGEDDGLRAAERDVIARVARGDEAAGGIGVELDMSDIQVPLTRDRVLWLQGELLEAFSRHEFQDRLRQLELRFAPTPGGTSSGEFRRERQALALEVQAQVLPKYGFQPTPEGVATMMKAIRSSFGEDPKVIDNIAATDRLLLASHTEPHDAPPTATATAPAAAAADSADKSPQPLRRTQSPQPRVHKVEAGDGYWIVVGGRKSGGLLVRLGEGSDSHAWPEPLETGAVIKEVQRVGDRVHYEKQTGRGPNYGWVSTRTKEHVLLSPYTGEVPWFSP